MKWQNSSYSPKDMAAMQQDAMERVREMQRRADETLRRSNPPPPASTVERPTPTPQPPLPPPAEIPTPAPAPLPDLLGGGKLNQLLAATGMDRDRLILLGLLLILWNDNADKKLLLALVYLLL